MRRYMVGSRVYSKLNPGLGLGTVLCIEQCKPKVVTVRWSDTTEQSCYTADLTRVPPAVQALKARDRARERKLARRRHFSRTGVSAATLDRLDRDGLL